MFNGKTARFHCWLQAPYMLAMHYKAGLCLCSAETCNHGKRLQVGPEPWPQVVGLWQLRIPLGILPLAQRSVLSACCRGSLNGYQGGIPLADML
jgi:hypothetical protein